MNFDAGFPLFITHKTVHEKYNEKYELTKDRLILVHAEFKVDKNLCEEEKKVKFSMLSGGMHYSLVSANLHLFI
jgi:hypothetical protein